MDPLHRRPGAAARPLNLPRQAAAAADRGLLAPPLAMSSGPELQGGIAQGIPVGPAQAGPAQVCSK